MQFGHNSQRRFSAWNNYILCWIGWLSKRLLFSRDHFILLIVKSPCRDTLANEGTQPLPWERSGLSLPAPRRKNTHPPPAALSSFRVSSEHSNEGFMKCLLFCTWFPFNKWVIDFQKNFKCIQNLFFFFWFLFCTAIYKPKPVTLSSPPAALL